MFSRYRALVCGRDWQAASPHPVCDRRPRLS